MSFFDHVAADHHRCLVQPGLPQEPAGAGGVRAALPTDVNNEITSADRMQLYATRQV